MHVHLRLAVLTALAALLSPLAVVTAQAPAQARAATTTTALRVATYNVQVRRSLDDFKAGVAPLLDRSDIVGLQEMDTREKWGWLASLSDQGWGVFAQLPSYQEAVLWRTDRFTFVSGRLVKVSDPVWIGKELPGQPSSQKARYVTVVRLLDTVTGRRVSVVNAHLLQGAVRGGKPWPGRPRVWATYRTGLANAAAVASYEQLRWGRVFAIGDFNAGWVADHKHLRRKMPIRTYSRLGMGSMWEVTRPTNGLGTHNDALIDQVFSSIRPYTAAVQFDLAGHSDHRPAIAYYATD